MLGKATGSEYLQSLPGEADTLANMLRTEAKRGAPEGIDWASLGGNIAGSLPAGSLKLLQGAGKLKAAANLAGSGAATGAALSSTTDAPLAQDVAIGAVAAPVVGGIASGVGKAISGRLRPDAEALKQAGVKMTPGQIMGGPFQRMEEGFGSIPILGDMVRNRRADALDTFNRAAANQAMAPVGQAIPKGMAPGNETIGHIADTLGGRYNDLYSKGIAKADKQFKVGLDRVIPKAQSLGQNQKDQLASILNAELRSRFAKSGQISGEDLQGAMSELKRTGRGLMSDRDFNDRQLGKVLMDVHDVLQKSVARNSPKGVAQDLKSNDLAYAMFTRLRDAASRTGSERGVFTPNALLQAVRNQDKSMGKGKFARGDALMQEFAAAGKNVLGNKVPDSGTPYRAMLPIALAAMHPISQPVAALGALGAAAYSPVGNSLIRGALTARPQAARSAGDALAMRNAEIARLLGPAAVPGAEALLAPSP
jgi:hypothetical protein